MVILGFVGNIASLACGPWAPACAGYFNYNFTRANGGSSSQALRGAFTAAASAYVFQQIGSHFNKVGADNINALRRGAEFSVKSFGGNLLTNVQVAQKIASHAAFGGISAYLSGGKFGHGFVSAGITKGAGGIFLPSGGNLSSVEIVKGAVVSAVIGGTTSAISGGKFANGAQTGTFQYLFNQLSEAINAQIERDKAARNYKAASEELKFFESLYKTGSLRGFFWKSHLAKKFRMSLI